jgi:hypothetical protein
VYSPLPRVHILSRVRVRQVRVGMPSDVTSQQPSLTPHSERIYYVLFDHADDTRRKEEA